MVQLHVPASPLEKLYVRMKQAEEFGKEFDERVERNALGLPPVKDREPIFIAESKQRRELRLREDREEDSPLAAEVARQSANVGDRIEEMAAEIARLRQEAEELKRAPRTPKTAQEHEREVASERAEKAAADRRNFPEGIPNQTWSKAQLTRFLTAYRIPPPEGGTQRQTVTGLLDYVLGEGRKMALFEEPTEEE